MSVARYNENRWPVPEGADPEEVRDSLSTFFPELGNATYEIDECTGDITFTVAAGTKGN